MGTQGVTFDEVSAAADSLQADGEAVTVEAVRDVLGAGSSNAIYRHLAEWRARNAPPPEPPRAELPEALLAGLADWARQFAEQSGAGTRDALAQTGSDIEELLGANEELETERDELQAQLDDLGAERDELLATLADRDEAIERLNAELRNARQVAMDALVNKAKDQLAIDGKDSQIATLRQEIERHVAAQAAESDARLRAEMELVGAVTARDSLEAELRDVRGQLDALKTGRPSARVEKAERPARVKS